MSQTLIILNPHAAGGKAGQLWTKLEPILWQRLGELVVAITRRPEEVAQHLDKAYASGLTRVISIGGDGTNHALVNALAQLNEQHPNGPPMVYGMLPIGTGRDWARSMGIPFDVEKAATWIAEAQPHPTDIGLLTYQSSGGLGLQREHFLNIASAGLSGEVDERVNRVRARRPWTFLKATVEALLSHKPQRMQVKLDGNVWFDDKAYVVVVANGTTFGHGMKIAPDARVDDGLFDVVVVEGISRLTVLAALKRVYDATHLTHPAVRFSRARQVDIIGEGSAVGLDLDGEHAQGQNLTFQVKPGLLHLLAQPTP
jgi:diacylglycerol kinase (ATP)